MSCFYFNFNGSFDLPLLFLDAPCHEEVEAFPCLSLAGRRHVGNGKWKAQRKGKREQVNTGITNEEGEE